MLGPETRRARRGIFGETTNGIEHHVGSKDRRQGEFRLGSGLGWRRSGMEALEFSPIFARRLYDWFGNFMRMYMSVV